MGHSQSGQETSNLKISMICQKMLTKLLKKTLEIVIIMEFVSEEDNVGHVQVKFLQVTYFRGQMRKRVIWGQMNKTIPQQIEPQKKTLDMNF